MADDRANESPPNPYATNSMEATTNAAAKRTPPVAERSGCGCVIRVLLGLFLLFLAVIALTYYVVMHTSWPLRSVARAIEKQGTPINLRLKGISGSISSGMQIKSMEWKTGQVTDVRVKYNGIVDILYSRRLILHEIHVGKAHLNITGFNPDSLNDGNAPPPQNANGGNEESPLKLFQIDRLSLNDIEIKDDKTGFLLSIPTILWTGFKAEKGKIEFGDLTANSDRLTIETTPSTSPEFQRHIQAVIFPKLHSTIRKPIKFSIDFAYAEDKFKYKCDIFDGKLTIATQPDQSAVSQCQGLNLDEYFDAVLPRELTVTTIQTDDLQKLNSLEIRGGSFKLGKRTFVITPQKLEHLAEAKRISSTLATSDEGGIQMSYGVAVMENDHGVPAISQQITSNPSMTPREVLAQLFYAKSVADLSESEQQELDKISASFRPIKQMDEAAAEPEKQE
ncbi:MAG: hypothetical protein WCJ09_12395 [Planctomycetota bacterium]